MTVKVILAFASSPVNEALLQLEKEFKTIDVQLKLGAQRDSYSVSRFSAVQFADMQRELRRLKPSIVHFSGHGSGPGGLCCEDKNGNAELISNDTLITLFSGIPSIECIILNACLSSSQAEVLSGRVQYVIGMGHGISDKAAISFSEGFYRALGEGANLFESFKDGANHVQHCINDEKDTPELWFNGLVATLPKKEVDGAF